MHLQTNSKQTCLVMPTHWLCFCFYFYFFFPVSSQALQKSYGSFFTVLIPGRTAGVSPNSFNQFLKIIFSVCMRNYCGPLKGVLLVVGMCARAANRHKAQSSPKLNSHPQLYLETDLLSGLQRLYPILKTKQEIRGWKQALFSPQEKNFFLQVIQPWNLVQMLKYRTSLYFPPIFLTCPVPQNP